MGAIKTRIGTGRELITLAEAKEHLRITHNDDDTYIETLCKSALAMVENYTDRLWDEYTVIEMFKAVDSEILLTMNRIIEIVEVTKDDGSIITVVDPNTYKLDKYSIPAVLEFINVPVLSNNLVYPLSVKYKSGIAVADEYPAPIKSAALLIIGHLYENRQDVVVGRTANELPKSSEYLMNPYIIEVV